MFTRLDFDYLKYALNRYKGYLYAAGTVFLIGLALGAVFYQRIEAAQWILSGNYFGGAILGTSFIVLLWNLFFSALVIIVIVAFAAASRYVWWLTFAVILIRSITFAAAMISLVHCFSAVGLIYALVFLVYQATVFFVATYMFILIRYDECTTGAYIETLRASFPKILIAVLSVLIVSVIICIISLLCKSVILFL